MYTEAVTLDTAVARSHPMDLETRQRFAEEYVMDWAAGDISWTRLRARLSNLGFTLADTSQQDFDVRRLHMLDNERADYFDVAY